MDRKAEWAEKRTADAERQLGKVYRAPSRALQRVGREIDREGIGRATRKLERDPAAFGRLRGWQFGPIKSAERREALRELAKAAPEGRAAPGPVGSFGPGNPAPAECRDRLEAARTREREFTAERGGGARWERVREVELAAKRASPQERERLTPEGQQRLQAIEKAQRERLMKNRPERGGADRQRDQDQQRRRDHGKNRDRDGPDRGR